ncbi:MAG: CRISPR-associated endonuclease Cas2 [Ilumatobacteraceae bacterium]
MALERRRYLVGYDIRDPKRLRLVHRIARQYGWSMQYSVFVCDLDKMEVIGLRQALGDVIHHRQDSVAIIDLGDPAERGRDCFEFMGVAPRLPTSGALIL